MEERDSASPQYVGGENLALTPFRLAEKRYKLYRFDRRAARRQQLPETDFSDVVDFRCPDANTDRNRSLIRRVNTLYDSQLQCFEFVAVPGLLFFPGAICEEEQQAFCRDAILRYGDSSQHPNHLSTHASKPKCTKRYEAPMRWATLGFSYDWTSKTYTREHYSAFPLALKRRIEEILHLCSTTTDLKDVSPSTYEPQTAIVNYFSVGSMMMAHQDVSEESMQHPLISISLGCSCVFLMGTSSRDDAPSAFWLRSGDVAIFSGPSRVAFHSIPRIMDDSPPHLCTISDENNENEVYWRTRMRHMRININVRQVYSESCAFLLNHKRKKKKKRSNSINT
ncbi:alkylated DNA repair protein, putative [Trypanosoma cruzi marinkellei]|uniref:Alkylated DNA repair protein, putative n=1 Tax=Trypanosoma cruzi marinkellei TaxID=85056 RepID=K2N2D3_TRYCR|nr:alkylated DNA repair protein, putative [Trypanosoma cruzi marinkellei]